MPLASGNGVPASIRHRLTVEPPAGLTLPDSILTSTGAVVAVDARPPVVLGAPLTGSNWAAVGSCCDGPHRRAPQPVNGAWYLAQRFAIDFNLLDAENRPGVGDPLLYTSFPTYGQPVFAVADATVVEAVDRYPDLNVGEQREETLIESAGGNRILLDLGEGRYAAYAHLQAGSVAVQVGDRVTRGQQIAHVGSSGTTGGPHLHFQVMDSPSMLVADGMQYVFETFELTGQTPSLAEVTRYYDTMEPIPITTENVGVRHNELPLGSDVITFPAPESGG